MMSTLTAPAITGVHPYADKFPMLPEPELQELAESILQNGLRQPIVLTEDGLILDGRNRTKACEMAGVTPTTVVYDGDDLAEYVIDSNSSRRHMSTGARAMSTALVLVAAERRKNGRWEYGRVIESGKSSESTDTWGKALRTCGFILDHLPELADLVVSGEVALDSAYRQAEHARDAERRKLEEQERLKTEEADAEAFVKENAPDLADRVDGKDLHTFSEARALWEQRNREEAARLRREKREEQDQREQRRKDLTLTYSTIAGALKTISTYGEYGQESLNRLMADYSPEYLSPSHYAEQFRVSSLQSGLNFIQYLIQDQENRNG